MKKLVINGGKTLSGKVTVSGAKNSTVALIPAAILADSPVTLEGVPNIKDVYSLIDILNEMNVHTEFNGSTLYIDPTEMVSIPMPSGKINSLRASYYFMGALLAKFGEGVVGLPGGCDLGPRPIDQHLKGFRALGAEVDNKMGAMHFKTPNGMEGDTIYFDVVSIGATINVMLAATTAKGVTTIENAAREPEIIDIATLLNKMGAEIRGAGTDTLRITGVDKLHGVTHTVIPDRIEAGSYLSIAVAVGDDLVVENVIVEHIESFVAKLNEVGVHFEIGEDSIHVFKSKEPLKPVSIKTQPYPGFATDLQQPVTPLLFLADGESTVVDTIYPKRVGHIPELKRMGADIQVEGDTILVRGGKKLTGAEVEASDLRAGAALVTAGLMAEGTTTITGVDNILRGYANIVDKLTAIGADIKMIDTDE